MSSFSDWSNDSQTHAQIAILESQIQKKDEVLNDKKIEVEHLKNENQRLRSLVDVLTGIKENLNTGDILDCFN